MKKKKGHGKDSHQGDKYHSPCFNNNCEHGNNKPKSKTKPWRKQDE